MYDLNEIRTFVSVMETGNLKDSSLKLGVSKSTLSRRINHLEQVLNQPLLRRQANRLIANEAGIKFLPFAQNMLNIADDGHKAIESLKEEVSGSLVVYVHTMLVQGWFSPLIFEFMECFPDIKMDIRTSNQSFYEIKSNDVCIWVGEPLEESLKFEKIGMLSQGLYTNTCQLEKINQVNSPSELDQCSWVDTLIDKQSGYVFEHEQQGIISLGVPASRLIVDQYELHTEAIMNGKGIGLLPHYFAKQSLLSGSKTLSPVLPEWKGRSLDVYLHYPFGHIPKKLQTFIQYLREGAKALY